MSDSEEGASSVDTETYDTSASDEGPGGPLTDYQVVLETLMQQAREATAYYDDIVAVHGHNVDYWPLMVRGRYENMKTAVTATSNILRRLHR